MSRRRFLAAVAALTVLLAGCSAAEGTKAGPGELVTTLTLVVPEQGESMPYLPDMRSFAVDVERRSDGMLRIELASAPLPWHVDTEVDLAKSVAAGDTQLALVPARALGALGIQRFEALEAPFLITSAAGGGAVEDSELASTLLGELGEGRTGLALLFETIRLPVGHPTALARAEDFAGALVRVSSSVVIPRTFEALGAQAVRADDFDVGPRGETLTGAESALAWYMNLSSDSIITVGVPLAAKFNVLVASTAVLQRLDDHQRDILAEAASALHERDVVTEASAQAEAYCRTDLGLIVAAPDDAARIQQLVAPVTAGLEEDPDVADAIADIRVLVADARPDELPSACRPPTGDSAPWPTP